MGKKRSFGQWICMVLPWIINCIATGFFVIGLGGFQDDLATWKTWLTAFDARWIWIVAGIVLALVVNLAPLVLRKLSAKKQSEEVSEPPPDLGECIRAIEEVVAASRQIRHPVKVGPLGACADYQHLAEQWRVASRTKLAKLNCKAAKCIPNRKYVGTPLDIKPAVAETIQKLEIQLAELRALAD